MAKKLREDGKEDQAKQIEAASVEDQRDRSEQSDKSHENIPHPLDIIPNEGVEESSGAVWPNNVPAEELYGAMSWDSLYKACLHYNRKSSQENHKLNQDLSHLGAGHVDFIAKAREFATAGVAVVNMPGNVYNKQVCSVTYIGTRGNQLGFCLIVPRSTLTGKDLVAEPQWIHVSKLRTYEGHDEGTV